LVGVSHAAQDAGGDASGQMSAALVVVDGSRPDDRGGGRVVDVRVDRHQRPLEELDRLVDAADAYDGSSVALTR